MYRPKDWNIEEIRKQANKHAKKEHQGVLLPNDLIEAGADAMLESLKKQGVHLNKGFYSIQLNFHTEKMK